MPLINLAAERRAALHIDELPTLAGQPSDSFDAIDELCVLSEQWLDEDDPAKEACVHRVIIDLMLSASAVATRHLCLEDMLRELRERLSMPAEQGSALGIVDIYCKQHALDPALRCLAWDTLMALRLNVRSIRRYSPSTWLILLVKTAVGLAHEHDCADTLHDAAADAIRLQLEGISHAL